MDISALGSQALNNARFDIKAPASPADGGGAAFADMLEKAKAAASPEVAAVPEPASPGIRKPAIDRSDKLYEQCLALETFLTKTLISGMRSTIQKTGLIDDSFAGKMYEDMLYDEYAKTYTKSAQFGLADLAYLELTGQRGKIVNNS
ncbi:MAG: rod-binding protein [Treponema sp.]|jgi:flagellar protein FlgJ|nr:rod-binding protein [Treponema sp.]